MAGTTSRGVVRTGARGVAVGTIAIAILGVLQQAIGAFDPRPSMSAAIVAAVAFASLVTKRLGDRRREDREAAELRRQLIVWPPRPLSEVDPAHLGAFPARRDLGPNLPYVPRTLDAELREAIEPGGFVLLHGPPLAGKTRTAHAAASAALPDARVIAPRSADALAELLALDSTFDAGAARVVWLEDLGRYAEMLDPATIDDVVALGAPASGRSAPAPAAIVATVRTDDWDALRAASGPAGLGARAVAAVARSFELPARLSPAELVAASERYPSVEIAGGSGSAIASTGSDQTVPRPVPAPVLPTPRPHPLRDVQLAAPAGLTVAAVTVAGLIWALAGFSTPTAPPIADQIASINRAAAREGRRTERPTGSGALDLHATGGDASYLFLFTDRPGSGRSPRADELRVYDVRDGYLRRSLRFEPREPGSRFQFRAATDVDFDGAIEVIGGYSQPDARQALVPFAIDFDDNRYELVPLVLGPPVLKRLELERRFRIPTRQYRPVYERSVAFTDRRDGTTLRGLRVQDFVVTSPRKRLVAGYFVQAPPSASDLAVLELQAGIFKAGGRPRVQRCALADGTVATASLRLDRHDEPTEMQKSWAAASEQRDCALVSGP